MQPMTPLDASSRLARLGFLLIRAVPHAGAEAVLAVGLHDIPTLQHYDAELVRFWSTDADRRGACLELTRQTPTPFAAAFSWGRITLIDRLGIDNEFVSLGGEVMAEEVEPRWTVAVFRSPGPILRLGGHSQPVDADAPDIGAFFGRLMVPVDFRLGAEQALSAASPLDRYAAYLAWEHARIRHHPVLRDENLRGATVVGNEVHRVRAEQPDAWARGLRLLDDIGLDAA